MFFVGAARQMDAFRRWRDLLMFGLGFNVRPEKRLVKLVVDVFVSFRHP